MALSTVFLAPMAYVLSVVMFLGNGMTIVAVFRFERLRTRANMYIVSLAATDALVGLLLFVVGSFYIPSLQPWFHSTEVACIGMYSWGYCTTVCSGLNMCLIALDRYIYIAKPFLYEQLVTEAKIKIAIFLAWMFAFIFGTVPFYYNNFVSSHECVMIKVIPTVFRSFVATSVFALCCVFTAVLYIKISILTLQHSRKINVSEPLENRAEKNSKKIRLTRGSLKALKLFVIVFGLMFVCWAPYFLADFVSGFTGEINVLLYKGLTMLGFVNSGVNMFIYPYFNKDFRSAFKSLICCCLRPRDSSRVIHVRTVTSELANTEK